MDIIHLYVSICGWLLGLGTHVKSTLTGYEITLTPSSSEMTLKFNSSEPFCNNPPCVCDQFGQCDYVCEVDITSPTDSILKASFLHLHVPTDDKMTFINGKNSEILLSLSGITSTIEPVYVDSSSMKITFDRCNGDAPFSYLEVHLSYTTQIADSLVLSSGGVFSLSNTSPSITIQSVDLSSLTNLDGELHWFITTISYIWIRVDIVVMSPGQDGDLCIFDTFDQYGEWVCMTETTPSTTWYSYDDELRIVYYINGNTRPDVGFTVMLSVVDHSSWIGQTLVLPACNPAVVLQEIQTIQFTTPYFGQSLQNVRYQCRMQFSSSNPVQPAGIEFHHLDVPGEVSVYGSPGFINLGDASRAKVDISPLRPVASISPTNEIYVDIRKINYIDVGNGVLVLVPRENLFTGASDPIASFGIALELNDTSSSREFTTLGYPALPEGNVNIRWYISNRINTDAEIEVEFIDFAIGAATLFVHVAEDPAAILLLSGSSLPDAIHSSTTSLELLLRSDNVCCSRGLHFVVSLKTFTQTTVPTTRDPLAVSTVQGSPTTGGKLTLTGSTVTTDQSTGSISTSDSMTGRPSTGNPLTLKTTVGSGSMVGKTAKGLVIGLSICLSVAFLLIVSLIGVVLYQKGKHKRDVDIRTNASFSSTVDLFGGDNASGRYRTASRSSNIFNNRVIPEEFGIHILDPQRPDSADFFLPDVPRDRPGSGTSSAIHNAMSAENNGIIHEENLQEENVVRTPCSPLPSYEMLDVSQPPVYKSIHNHPIRTQGSAPSSRIMNFVNRVQICGRLPSSNSNNQQTTTLHR